MAYIYLGLAIIAEVIATSTLKATNEFTRVVPTIVVLVGYGTSLFLLTLVLRTIPVGITYAVWAGLGIVLVAIVSSIAYRQIPDWPAIIGMGLIVAGAATIQATGQSGLRSCGPAHQREDLLEGYREALIASVAGRRLDGCRIVLDLCWGSATACGAAVFRSLGADLTVLHGEPDGQRINVSCGSTHLEALRQAVLQSGAHMGFAFDGDADRMMAVDGKGRVVDGDQVLYLWGGALLETDALPGRLLVATVMSNLGFERAWQARGGLLQRTDVGDQHVHAAMEASGAGLGGEQSGHILSAQHGMSGDGLLTALQVATLIHNGAGSLADWMEASFEPYPQALVNVIVPDRSSRQQWQRCDPLRQAVEQAETAMAGNGRVLVRASGTEPLVGVMVEAAEQEAVDHWSSHLAALASTHLNRA